MKCAKNVGGECSVNDFAQMALPFGFGPLFLLDWQFRESGAPSF
jgi:hypothetical protein